MISKVLLKNVASYGNKEAILETDKKYNLLYGLNGTGKTTFSSYLSNIGNSNFSYCSIEGLNGEKVLVYNQNFIDKNFYEEENQKGIFTLRSENKEVKEKINEAKNKIKELKKEIKNDEKNIGLKIDLTKKKEEIKELFNKSKNKTWEIKENYYLGNLDFCLDGKKNSKDILFNFLKDLDKKEIKKTIKELEELAKATQGNDVKIYNENEIIKIDFDFSNIEKNSIFNESVIGNKNSQISKLILKLDNGDWIKDGLNYIDDNSDICPFCQKETLTNTLKEEIKKYFDESYKTKVYELERFGILYEKELNKIEKNKELLLKNDFIKKKKNEFELYYEKFLSKLKSNYTKIGDKIKNPSKIIDLELSNEEKNKLNLFLDNIITEIKTHNSKVKNKDNTKKEIINDFWNIIRIEYNDIIENYKNESEKLLGEEKEIEEKISELGIEIEEQESIITLLQKEIINIDEAIGNINNELKFLGLEGFRIVKYKDKLYKIERNLENNSQFKTLSEGEKTIISFLYFLELCKGREGANETINEKIIVIDDPISSLSHIYIFNISQLIRKTFFNNNYKQIFILTHSLYFFHEFIKMKELKKKKKLFRILKNNESTIIEMKDNEIQNDYHAYWQIIKDYRNNGLLINKALLANSMRNILEHFFGFIEKEKLKDTIKELDENKYNYFIRYIDRESHSDFINICDMKEINSDIFMEAFKDIFDKSGYINHYKKMIGN